MLRLRLILPSACLLAILIFSAAVIGISRAEDSAKLSSDPFEHLSFGLDSCASGPEPLVSDQERDQIISDMNGNSTYWSHLAFNWMTIYWTAVLVSLTANAFTASNLISETTSFKWKTYTALLAALSTSFLATVNPQAQAGRYREAFLYLKTAVETYRYDPRMTRCHLVRAYGEAESLAQLGTRVYGTLSK